MDPIKLSIVSGWAQEAFEFGLDGSIDTTTYFVDPKGVIYDINYDTEVIPAM